MKKTGPKRSLETVPLIVDNCAGKRGMVGGPGPVGPPGYCQFCDALAMQANRQSNKKGP